MSPTDRTEHAGRLGVLLISIAAVTVIIIIVFVRQADIRSTNNHACQADNYRWEQLVKQFQSFPTPTNETPAQKQRVEQFYKAIGPVDCAHPPKGLPR